MKTLIKLYFKTLSFLSPRLAGYAAFDFFQRTHNKKIRPKELAFFKAAKRFKIEYYLEDISCYELGPISGPLVILVHGWESNAASMSAIGLKLAEEGHHVILFDLPAHGFSKLKKANLKICKDVLLEVIYHLNPVEPFSIVSHSFGSAVATYALSRTTYRVDNLVMLTSPNHVMDVFQDFSRIIGLNNKAYQNMCNRASKLLREPLVDLAVENFGNKFYYNHLTLIQDENDKVIPKENASRIYHAWDRSELKLLQNKGHYRMLWDQEVIDLVLSAVKKTIGKIEISSKLEAVLV